jgi:predicted AAA+ superfamily ATPase
MELNYRQIVTEQQKEIPVLLKLGWVAREQETEVRIDSRLVQVITGVRRSGKSTLAHRAMAGTLYAYANFDDERLSGIKPDQLNNLLEALYAVYGDFKHLILDEIQNVEQWHLFVNRLLRNDIRIIITGSNSKLLSKELASHLTGRYSTIEMFPYSFREFLRAKGYQAESDVTARLSGMMINYLNEYMVSGGFPEIVSGEPAEPYAGNLFEAIVTRDIVYRYDIRNVRALRETATYLAANASTEMSYNRIKNLFGLGSENTAKNYVAYLEEAWLILTMPKFSFKHQEALRNRKSYVIDTAFCGKSGVQFSLNSGRVMENVVFLELRRRSRTLGYEVFYYKNVVEVDFVIYSNQRVTDLIQVAQETKDEKTRNREVRALIAASDGLSAARLTIITMDEEMEIEEGGKKIYVVRMVDWLTGDLKSFS